MYISTDFNCTIFHFYTSFSFCWFEPYAILYPEYIKKSKYKTNITTITDIIEFILLYKNKFKIKNNNE